MPAREITATSVVRADIHHHVEGSVMADPHPWPRPGSQSENFTCTGALGDSRTARFFHLGDARGHTDDDPGPNQSAAVVHFGNKVPKHSLGHPKSAMTLLSWDGWLRYCREYDPACVWPRSHGQHLIVAPVISLHGHHGRPAQDDALAPHIRRYWQFPDQWPSRSKRLPKFIQNPGHIIPHLSCSDRFSRKDEKSLDAKSLHRAQ